MKKILHFIIVCSGLVFSMQSFAGIRLPAVISSNMVLQQQSGVALWGWADPAEKIVITTSWNNANRLSGGNTVTQPGKLKLILRRPVVHILLRSKDGIQSSWIIL